MGAMKIRKGRPGDAKIIADFNTRLAWETEGMKLDAPTILRGVQAALRDKAKGTYFVVEVEGKVVGQLLITFEWSDWRNGNFWWIQSVYVAAEHRQNGIFRALFGYVEKLARTRKDSCGLRLYVEHNNHRAQQTYRRLGMRQTHYQVFETEFRRKTAAPKSANRKRSSPA